MKEFGSFLSNYCTTWDSNKNTELNDGHGDGHGGGDGGRDGGGHDGGDSMRRLTGPLLVDQTLPCRQHEEWMRTEKETRKEEIIYI